MIGIIDVDMTAQSKKRFPNLASMKISSYWKNRGEEAFLSAIKRMRTLAKYEILPYVMRFKSCYDSPFDSLFATLAAWANQPAFCKKMTFADFCKKRGDKPMKQYRQVKGKELLDLMNTNIWSQPV